VDTVRRARPRRSKTVQVDPIKPALKAPGINRLKLEFDKPLSNFAFKFSLRRYAAVAAAAAHVAAAAAAAAADNKHDDGGNFSDPRSGNDVPRWGYPGGGANGTQ